MVYIANVAFFPTTNRVSSLYAAQRNMSGTVMLVLLEMLYTNKTIYNIVLIIDTPVESFLHKLSSGGQKVWQKRYFSITADGRHLVYKATKDAAEASHKRVDLRRVRNH